MAASGREGACAGSCSSCETSSCRPADSSPQVSSALLCALDPFSLGWQAAQPRRRSVRGRERVSFPVFTFVHV